MNKHEFTINNSISVKKNVVSCYCMIPNAFINAQKLKCIFKCYQKSFKSA